MASTLRLCSAQAPLGLTVTPSGVEVFTASLVILRIITLSLYIHFNLFQGFALGFIYIFQDK
jgi:hypothetical protein